MDSLSAILEALGDEEVRLMPPALLQGTMPRYGGIGVLVDLPRPGKDRILVLSVYPGSLRSAQGFSPMTPLSLLKVSQSLLSSAMK